MNFFWRRAAPGIYVLRDHDGLGPSCGGITSTRVTGGASTYKATFDHRGLYIGFQERGSPNTVIALLEAAIVEQAPSATFQRIGFK